MENQFITTEGSAFTEEVVKETFEHHNNEKHIKNVFYSPAQIWNKIKKLNDRKAPDLVSNSCLKYLRKKALPHTHI